MSLSTRFTLAAGAVALALLALPSLASANPGAGPQLVQRSGRLVVLHADRLDGTSTRQWTLVSGSRHVPVRLPGDLWIDPGTPVRLEGTMVNGALVLADSASAVEREGPSPLAADAPATAAAPAVQSTAVILVSYSDLAWSGASSAQADDLVFGAPAARPDSVNAYYQEQTYGQLTFDGDVFGPVTIPKLKSASCDDVYDNAAALPSMPPVSATSPTSTTSSSFRRTPAT